MEKVSNNGDPERREVGAAHQQVSTDPQTFQSALCAQPLTRGACPIVAQSFEPFCCLSTVRFDPSTSQQDLHILVIGML